MRHGPERESGHAKIELKGLREARKGIDELLDQGSVSKDKIMIVMRIIYI